MPLCVVLAAACLANQAGVTAPGQGKPSDEPRTLAAFEHVSNKLNTSGNVTTLDHPSLNGKADAILLATRVGVFDQAPAPIGVWFNNGKWTIFRQDRQPLKHGERFVVEAFQRGPHAFEVTHKANGTHLSAMPSAALPRVKGKGLFVTAAYTSTAVYNANTLGTWHDGSQWQIFQTNLQPIAENAAFHVVYGRAEQVGLPPDESSVFLELDAPWLNSAPESLLSAGITFEKSGGAYVPKPVTASFIETKWRLAASMRDELPANSSFFIRKSGVKPLSPVLTMQGELAKPATFKLTVLGFNCITETADNVLETDGKGDEVFFVISAAIRSGEQTKTHFVPRFGVFGEVTESFPRIKAGTRGPNGGVKTGDVYLNPGVGQPGGRDPMTVIQVKLEEGQTLCLVPSIWDQDHRADEANIRYFQALKPAAVSIASWRGSGEQPYWFNFDHLKRGSFLPGEYPDMPIGALEARLGPGQVASLSCQLKALFMDSKELAKLADSSGPYGTGTFTVRQGYQSNPAGCYDMVFKVERIL